jgi:hypothetical protein
MLFFAQSVNEYSLTSYICMIFFMFFIRIKSSSGACTLVILSAGP